MYKKIIVSCVAVVSLFGIMNVNAKEPINLQVIKKQVVEYHDSGAFQHDQAEVIKQATDYLRVALNSPSKKPLAIVLDIDETSLSNYPNLVSMDFGGTKEMVDAAEKKGVDPVIQPTLTLYHFAKAHNVAVFFITGRKENSRASTVKNLNRAGFANWDGLTLKPENYHEDSASPYKINARKQIVKKGYDIVLNIGDQYSDLKGGYADRSFKLPNPYYYIP